MQSKRASIKRLISKKNKVSCHYLIDRADAKYFQIRSRTKLPGIL